jgi:UTP--glucose-1-phosphate uridylyltransferase
MRTVKKAVIPAAGLGTRFLPATKTIPKEMLPIVDMPILLYVVEEAARAGVEDIILVAGRHKNAIEDFFDKSYEVEDLLEKAGKLDILERVIALRNKVNIISIRQKSALGLGHAVLCAAPIVGKDPFAVLLGDEIMISPESAPTVTAQLTNIYTETGLSTVAIMEVPRNDVVKYGIISGKKTSAGYFRVDDVVEKPSVESAPSQLALPGRYVFSAKLFTFLKNTKPGKNGEIQLTDGMTALARDEGLLASFFKATRYDAGDKFGYLQANIELALQRPELAGQLGPYLKELAKSL